MELYAFVTDQHPQALFVWADLVRQCMDLARDNPTKTIAVSLESVRIVDRSFDEDWYQIGKRLSGLDARQWWSLHHELALTVSDGHPVNTASGFNQVLDKIQPRDYCVEMVLAIWTGLHDDLHDEIRRIRALGITCYKNSALGFV